MLAAQIFLGIMPDAANGRCYLQPWLPGWLPALTLHGIGLAGARLDVKIARSGSVTELEYFRHPTLEAVAASVEAPLWGAPFASSSARVPR